MLRKKKDPLMEPEIAEPISSTPTVSATVATKSQVYLGVAVAFLGLAAIVAGFAGMFEVKKPDLVISAISFNTDDNIQKVSVYYQNIGRAPVTTPFDLAIGLNPQIGILALNMGSDTYVMTEIGSGTGVYKHSIKDYHLGVNEYGVAEFMVMKFPANHVPEQLKIGVMVDRFSEVEESNEKNNIKQVTVAQNDLLYYKPDLGYGYGYNKKSY